MKIRELCEDERPREKMLSKGPGSMSNAELLAILLGTGTQKENALEVANRLLARCDGNLDAVAGMGRLEMMETDGIGPVKYASIAAAMELGRRSLCTKKGGKVRIDGAKKVWEIVRSRLSGLAHEELWIMYLDSANHMTGLQMVSKGGSRATVIDPKIIVKEALDRRARGIIMIHNHPSGNPRPGERDITETDNMKKAVNTFDIDLLDHVIVCDGSFFSFADDRVTVPE